MALRRPFRGLRGDFVVEQQNPDTGVWHALEGAATEEAARRKMRLYFHGQKRITPNRPGDTLPDDSFRP